MARGFGVNVSIMSEKESLGFDGMVDTRACIL